MGLRDRLRRLEHGDAGLLVHIPQADGSVQRFSKIDLEEAFANECRRLRGEDLPEHPVTRAASISSDPVWRNSGLTGFRIVGEELQDLSE